MPENIKSPEEVRVNGINKTLKKAYLERLELLNKALFPKEQTTDLREYFKLKGRQVL